MEYCSLGSLCDVMEINNKTLNEKQIAYICREALKGLEYLHTVQSVIHMDIKGANILINERGQIKLGNA
jgi:serine/threonine protein kinase